MKLNDKYVGFECDTGSFISTLNIDSLNKINNYSIKDSTIRAKSYDDKKVNFLGQVDLLVEYNGSKMWHTFQIVSNSKVSLIGRDLCKKIGIKLSIPCSSKINSINSDVLKEFEDYLSENFVSNIKSEIYLKLDEGTKPIFMNYRPVPLRFDALVKEELARLETSGIISRVFNSEWATPVVTVLKDNGKVRLCGDYSVTLNKHMQTVKYPLPRIEDVISRLGGSKVWSRLDMQAAYLQLPLDEPSKKLTTINTSEGLFSFNYLPFGCASSAGIFQSFMCKTLASISKNLIIYQDDLLIHTKTKEEHDIVLRSFGNTKKYWC